MKIEEINPTTVQVTPTETPRTPLEIVADLPKSHTPNTDVVNAFKGIMEEFTEVIKQNNIQTETLVFKAQQLMNSTEQATKGSYDKLTKQSKVAVSVSSQYKKYLGSNLQLSINGITIYVPIDSRTYHIPEDYANILNEIVSKIDAKENRVSQSPAGTNAGVKQIQGDVLIT